MRQRHVTCVISVGLPLCISTAVSVLVTQLLLQVTSIGGAFIDVTLHLLYSLIGMKKIIL